MKRYKVYLIALLVVWNTAIMGVQYMKNKLYMAYVMFVGSLFTILMVFGMSKL